MASGEGRIERRLLCELTDEDVQSRGRMLAETVVQIDAVIAEKRAATKVFGDKLAGLGEQQRDLTKAIRDRGEWRIVACAVRFHSPQEGEKEIARLDTGEVVESLKMTDAEKQMHLFALDQEVAEFAAAMDAAAGVAEPGPSLQSCAGCGYAPGACECGSVADDLPAEVSASEV